jgi:transcriptional regulator with XRE-family HTH domain
MIDNIKFGQYLSELRFRNKIETQKEFADKSGLSAATISQIEAGIQRAKPEHLSKIAPSQ